MESNSDKYKLARTLLCKQIGSTIKEIRKEKNIQQQDLAAACNFEKSNMARIESGNVNVTVGTLLKIAFALDISINELFK